MKRGKEILVAAGRHKVGRQSFDAPMLVGISGFGNRRGFIAEVSPL